MNLKIGSKMNKIAKPPDVLVDFFYMLIREYGDKINIDQCLVDIDTIKKNPSTTIKYTNSEIEVKARILAAKLR